MRLGATITSERGKAVTKTANTELVVTINIENIDIGRIVTRYEGVNPTRIYYYPIGGSGRTLLYEKINENLKHDKCKHGNVPEVCATCKWINSRK